MEMLVPPLVMTGNPETIIRGTYRFYNILSL
jgi:hypothetical protein